ncbi:tyrosine-type recombinase/integrase [Salinibacter sp.]|uniref:tyrosine-type recombinase/integrase n=1 Tax=Salinibacter sp. TaxID=2065818 RepID=UPI0021E80F6F|nr:tyrosine-type recombinase/integrase [Salinibacter sp.]
MADDKPMADGKSSPPEDTSEADSSEAGASEADGSEADASEADASENLPATSGGSLPAGDGSGSSEHALSEETSAEEAVADEAVAEEEFADEAFAEDVAGAEDFSEKALSERTRKAYRRAWDDFLQYCEAVGKDPLPARPVAVAAYINNRARARPTDRGAPKNRSDEGLAASTLKQRLAGIKYVHEAEGYASPTGHPQVARVMQGIRNDTQRQEALPRTEAAPLVSSDLKQALKVLPGSGPAPPQSETADYARWLRGRRDRALMLLGFATALRPRELVSVEKKHVARGAKGKAEGLIVHIPRSKADQEAEGQTATALKNEADPTYCPVRALSRWRRAASIEEGPLFRGVRRSGDILPGSISYKTPNRLVKRACREAGLEPEGFSDAKRRRYSAHSLRAGHVTDASSHGAPDNILMMQTRHADPKTLRRYDRPAQQLEESSSAFLGLYRDE